MIIDYSVDADGIASITWNMTEYPMNVLNAQSIASFAEAVQRAVADPAVKGVIITSARSDFIAGADLNMMLKIKEPAAVAEFVGNLHTLLRGMETCGKPFVAAINGAALGGGYEISLACHHRIAADNPRSLIGLPEVTIGLFPAGGGTQRLSRRIGLRAALPFLLEGRKLDPRRALEAGLVDQLVPPGELLAQARLWLLEHGPANAVQPWDKKGFQLPGGAVQSPHGQETFTLANAMLRAKTFGNYPAPLDILSCVYEGCQTDIDTGIQTEIRHFVKLAVSPEAKNMIRTQFFAIGEANKLARRPKGVPPSSIRKIGVIGAGWMGAGIARASAEAGLEVALLDTTVEAARQGTDIADLADCDLVIEAAPGALPVIRPATGPERPGHPVRLHFFGPADKTPLVEIICGTDTGDESLARAMDYVRKIRKTPIVVDDGRGCYTSRVASAYIDEAMAMLAEGVAPALIENAGRHAGMRLGPLALADQLAGKLPQGIGKQAAVDDVSARVIERLPRLGDKTGQGFYDYPAGGDKRLWPGVTAQFPRAAHQPDTADVRRRLLYAQSIEAARCLEEGVVRGPQDADVAACLGCGFPAYLGGPVSQIHSVGVERFVQECEALAARHGARFAPPALLKDMANRNEAFYEA